MVGVPAVQPVSQTTCWSPGESCCGYGLFDFDGFFFMFLFWLLQLLRDLLLNLTHIQVNQLC